MPTFGEAEPGKDLPLTILIPFSSSALCQSKRSVCAFDDINTSLTVVADSETGRSAKPKVYRRYRVKIRMHVMYIRDYVQ